MSGGKLLVRFQPAININFVIKRFFLKIVQLCHYVQEAINYCAQREKLVWRKLFCIKKKNRKDKSLKLYKAFRWRHDSVDIKCKDQLFLIFKLLSSKAAVKSFKSIQNRLMWDIKVTAFFIETDFLRTKDKNLIKSLWCNFPVHLSMFKHFLSSSLHSVSFKLILLYVLFILSWHVFKSNDNCTQRCWIEKNSLIEKWLSILQFH